MSFNHSHIDEAYDEYKTEDGFHRITVRYENGEFKQLEIRAFHTNSNGRPNPSSYENIKYDNLSEINELITALHAAIAGINKKGPSQS